MGFSRRILVVDDEPIVTSLVSSVLTSAGFDVAIAAEAPTVMDFIDSFDPDAVLLDIQLGDGPSGLDLGHSIAAQRPDIAVIYLSRYADPRSAGTGRDDLPAGSGYLHKDRIDDASFLVESIDAVLRGHPELAQHTFEHGDALSQLSAKHMRVLRLLATGYTNEYIAQVQGVVLGTVERWNNEIFEILGVSRDSTINRRVEVVRRYIASAGIPPKE